MAPFINNMNEVKLSTRSEEHLAEMQNAIVVPIEKKYADKTTQYLAAGIVTIAAFSSGTFLAWTSSALPLLLTENAHIKVSPHEGSWIASLLNFGAFIGAIPTGLIAERFGRKKTLLSLAIPMTVAWLLIALSTSVYCFYVGRFVGGVAVGAISVAVPPYVVEMAHPTARDAVGNFYQIQLTSGILFGFLAGMAGNVTVLSLICAIVPAVYFVAFLFMPESPVYLMTQGKVVEARNSLLYIRGIGCDIDEELTRIKEYIIKTTAMQGRFKDMIATRSNVKALVVAFTLMVFQQLSGISALIFYMGKIFSMSGTKITPETSAVIVGIIQVASAYMSAAFLSRIGRRPMLILSNLFMGANIAGLGIYFHLNAMTDTEDYHWVPIVCLSGYVSLYSIGIGPIPWLMLREIFPSNIRRRATAIAAGLNWFLAFAVTKFYQNMVDSVGIGWVLWNFGSICAIAATFVYFFVPETKDKSLDQIHKELNGNKLRKHRHIIEIDSISIASTK
ncbi:facilitated trehalose transporter Tret1-like [Arctopsyche grandis]|uniref:facilitated trehalose transporter Tret1-like n=1 Tax=Arctopsyche grandis TaxID=121162 RepID=UPI00406DA114